MSKPYLDGRVRGNDGGDITLKENQYIELFCRRSKESRNIERSWGRFEHKLVRHLRQSRHSLERL